MTQAPADRPRRPGGPPARYTALRALDSEWIEVAAAWGFSVAREPGAYVAYCGDDVIRVAPYDDLDPDDCLAQVVLHELCHFAVEGDPSRRSWDWGLDNTTDADVDAEYAAVRAQAVVLDPFGLRDVLAPTTDFRTYYDALPSDPLDGPPAVCDRAAVGAERLRSHPEWRRLARALEHAAAVAGVEPPIS